MQASKVAVGMIIVVLNAALLLLYIYLMLQFLVLPWLRPRVPHLVRQTSQLASRSRGLASHLSWRSRPEPSIAAAAAPATHVASRTAFRQRTTAAVATVATAMLKLRQGCRRGIGRPSRGIVAGGSHASFQLGASCTTVIVNPLAEGVADYVDAGTTVFVTPLAEGHVGYVDAGTADAATRGPAAAGATVDGPGLVPSLDLVEQPPV